jgi:glycosyltransferase involved in cell wall biosynthesis
MLFWIVTIFEPVPGVDTGGRAHRSGLLAEALLRHGHQVVCWTSTFHHVRKVSVFPVSQSLAIAPGYRMELLHAPSYHRNVSWARFRHNRVLARAFRAAAEMESNLPTVIFACVPGLEMAEAAVEYGRARGVPVVVDTRDRWPDLYLTAVPRLLRPLARVLLASEFRRADRVYQGASGLTGVSETNVAWALRLARRERQSCDGVFPVGAPDPAGASETAEVAARLRALHRLRPEAMLVTFLGTFGASYDLETVVEAARILEAGGERRAQFVIAGRGEAGDRLAQRARGLETVTFLGWLDQRELLALLSISGVGLAPYRQDALQSLPNKPFDYMAAGIPTLSSLGGELAELLDREHVGRPYRAHDPASLAESVRWLLEHPLERAEMGRLARALFESFFRAEVIYPRLAAHLVSLSRGECGPSQSNLAGVSSS